MKHFWIIAARLSLDFIVLQKMTLFQLFWFPLTVKKLHCQVNLAECVSMCLSTGGETRNQWCVHTIKYRIWVVEIRKIMDQWKYKQSNINKWSLSLLYNDLSLLFFLYPMLHITREFHYRKATKRRFKFFFQGNKYWSVYLLNSVSKASRVVFVYTAALSRFQENHKERAT